MTLSDTLLDELEAIEDDGPKECAYDNGCTRDGWSQAFRKIRDYFTAEKSQGRDWQAIEALLPGIEDTMQYAMELAYENKFYNTAMVFRERLAKLHAVMRKE